MRKALVALASLAALTGCSKSGSPEATANASTATQAVPHPSPSAAASTATADAGVETTGATSANGSAGGPYNVLLVSIDSLRADMPWAGYDRPIAPRLSALHAKSTAYTRAYATSSFTSKSLAGVLTGRYPSELARTGSFFTRYLAQKDFLCTQLAAVDIGCSGGHAHMYFGPKQSGYESGFGDWRLVSGIKFDYQTDPYVTSDKLTPLAIQILGDAAQKAKPDHPFFAWFHYMDPHDEYKTHTESPHFGKRARDLYDEEVFYTDLWIGKLLDWVETQPWSKRTVIVITADHGEAFGEHGLMRHAHELWEELIRVPLFFYVPGQAPRTIDEPRGHIDLAPTFAELLGAKVTLAGSGTSLVPELTGGSAAPRDVIADLPEDEYNERRRVLVHGTTKLISFGNDARFALYDLAADPGEKKDLIRTDTALATEMRARYKEVSKRIVDVAPTGGIPKHDK
ncbi:Choline-sulfatase [Labilithrix luteola]|uniref:Choline-sulfatase n=1 Tax=Labilithrix luteola TaxID=1391654 RepID=A0A0K1QE44_9BACT|nr:sulfatase [Labilithrix luteola]AKV04041.1 Choline-sulfatase [Labilithrix luteola]